MTTPIRDYFNSILGGRYEGTEEQALEDLIQSLTSQIDLIKSFVNRAAELNLPIPQYTILEVESIGSCETKELIENHQRQRATIGQLIKDYQDSNEGKAWTERVKKMSLSDCIEYLGLK